MAENGYKEKPPTFTEWYIAECAKDKENILPPPLPYDLGIHFLKQYLLGEDWYVNYPGSADQINTEIVAEIMLNYPSAKYKKYPWYKKLYLKLKCFFTYRHIWEYY